MLTDNIHGAMTRLERNVYDNALGTICTEISSYDSFSATVFFRLDFEIDQ